jgi:hypothetical protein
MLPGEDVYMEPITNISDLVLARAVTLELIDGEGAIRPVSAELTYDRNDPFAVSLLIGDGGNPIEWTFARELLSEGVHEPCGDGDVHVWPSLSDHGLAIVLLELSSQDGAALLQANPREMVTFLRMSHALVAPGEESLHCDIDAVIASILAVQPPPAPPPE